MDQPEASAYPGLAQRLTPQQVLEAMHDERVQRALALALRDRQIRRTFRSLRRQGFKVDEAIEVLAEQHYLSHEHLRTIVYGKQRAKRRRRKKDAPSE